MKISEALHSIAKRDIVLPEFQREYVWNREQAKQLLVSLAKGYPVGGLLIWKTDTPPELKNVGELPDKLGTMMVLLDGQQRLTTLHMLITGEIPAYYRPEAAGWNDSDDVVMLTTYLRSVDPAGWQPSTLVSLPELADEEDRAEEVAFVRENWTGLVNLYRQAATDRCVVVCER